MLDTSSSFTDVFYPLGETLLSILTFCGSTTLALFEKPVFPQNRTTLMDAL